MNIFVLSANRPESLEAMAHNIRGYIEKHPDRVADLAFTLAMKRDTLRHRTCLLMNPGSKETENGLCETKFPMVKSTPPSPVSFVFTGQGAQWPQMGHELLDFPVFASTLHDLDNVLHKIQPKNDKWSLLGKCQSHSGNGSERT